MLFSFLLHKFTTYENIILFFLLCLTATVPLSAPTVEAKQEQVWEFNIVEIIKHFEGFRSEAYQDSAGIWTIGYGHTKGVKKGDKITKEQADKFLEQDLEDARLRVANAIMGKDLVITSNEFEALVSLAYNLHSFEKLAKHLTKDKKLFKKKMLEYCKDVKGNYLKGLKIRRIAERLLFEGKEWQKLAKELQTKSLDDIQEIERSLFV